MNYRILGLLMLLGLLLPVSGHGDEQHSTPYKWKWHKSIDNGDKFKWDYSVVNPDTSFNDKITVEVTEKVNDLNIVARLEDDPTFLIDGTGFEVSYPVDISTYGKTFSARELILPIVLEYDDGEKTTIFEKDMEISFGLPYVFLPLNSNVSDVVFTKEDKFVTVTGDFNNSYYPPTDEYLSTGDFVATYSAKTGLLDSFYWSTDDGRYEETLQLKLSIFQRISYPAIITISIILPVILRRKLNNV